MSATSLQHKQKEIWTLSFYSEYFSLCVSLPQPSGSMCPKMVCTYSFFGENSWKQSSAKQIKLSWYFLTQVFKCTSHVVRMTPVPASLHLLLLNASAGQDFVFLTDSASATLCTHGYSGNVIKTCGSSTKQLLYFGAGLHRFLLGEPADVQMGCTQSWAWCLVGLSGDALCSHCVCPGVAVHGWHCKDSGNPVQILNWSSSCGVYNSHNVWNHYRLKLQMKGYFFLK